MRSLTRFADKFVSRLVPSAEAQAVECGRYECATPNCYWLCCVGKCYACYCA